MMFRAHACNDLLNSSWRSDLFPPFLIVHYIMSFVACVTCVCVCECDTYMLSSSNTAHSLCITFFFFAVTNNADAREPGSATSEPAPVTLMAIKESALEVLDPKIDEPGRSVPLVSFRKKQAPPCKIPLSVFVLLY